jgi:hypothetical protein
LKGKEKFTLGKDRICDIQIQGWRVAPIQCVIQRSSIDYYIEPHPDAKPPTLNGKKISDKVKLRSGDVIGIGGSKLKFE